MAKRKVRETDWKKLADKMAGRLIWAIERLDVRGSGGVMNMRTGSMQSWREFLLEPVRSHPGITLDDDVITALDMTPRARRSRLAQLRKERALKANP